MSFSSPNSNKRRAGDNAGDRVDEQSSAKKLKVGRGPDTPTPSITSPMNIDGDDGKKVLCRTHSDRSPTIRIRKEAPGSSAKKKKPKIGSESESQLSSPSFVLSNSNGLLAEGSWNRAKPERLGDGTEVSDRIKDLTKARNMAEVTAETVCDYRVALSNRAAMSKELFECAEEDEEAVNASVEMQKTLTESIDKRELEIQRAKQTIANMEMRLADKKKQLSELEETQTFEKECLKSHPTDLQALKAASATSRAAAETFQSKYDDGIVESLNDEEALLERYTTMFANTTYQEFLEDVLALEFKYESHELLTTADMVEIARGAETLGLPGAKEADLEHSKVVKDPMWRKLCSLFGIPLPVAIIKVDDIKKNKAAKLRQL